MAHPLAGRPLLSWTRTGSRGLPDPWAALTSEVERAVEWDHGARRASDAVDDLGVVDSLQIYSGDVEVGVAELALDNEQGARPRASSTVWAWRS